MRQKDRINDGRISTGLDLRLPGFMPFSRHYKLSLVLNAFPETTNSRSFPPSATDSSLCPHPAAGAFP